MYYTYNTHWLWVNVISLSVGEYNCCFLFLQTTIVNITSTIIVPVIILPIINPTIHDTGEDELFDEEDWSVSPTISNKIKCVYEFISYIY